MLPKELWPMAFATAHDSVWAVYLRGPQTYARMAVTYWWPAMRRTVDQ